MRSQKDDSRAQPWGSQQGGMPAQLAGEAVVCTARMPQDPLHWGPLPMHHTSWKNNPQESSPNPPKSPRSCCFVIQSDPALWITSRTRSARQSVTRAETHRGLAPDFPLQTLLLWAPPNHLSLQPWSVSLDSNTHFQAHCSEGDPSLVPTGCTRTALRGDVPWD